MIMYSEIANHMSIKIFRALRGAVISAALAWSHAAQAEVAPLRVVTSFYPVYVAALNVAGGTEGVEIVNMTSPHIGCLHDYQLTAGDARRLAEADLLLANGAGMEPFLDKVRRQSPDLRVVEVSEGIPLMDGNPHVWVSFEGARLQAGKVAEALAAAAPDRAEVFRANARSYAERLSAQEEKMRAALAPYAGAPVITFHEAFPYFAREFGLRIVGVIESGHGSEPSARELADTIKLVRERGVKALFTEPQYAARSAQVIARESGVKVRELDPVSTGPSEPAAAREAYLQAMEKNLAVLQEALR